MPNFALAKLLNILFSAQECHFSLPYQNLTPSKIENWVGILLDSKESPFLDVKSPPSKKGECVNL